VSGRPGNARHSAPRLEELENRLVPAVFIVNTVADTPAVNLTTGQDSAGNISLRSAIQAANANSGAGKGARTDLLEPIFFETGRVAEWWRNESRRHPAVARSLPDSARCALLA
jgi:hypothetical protein